MAGRKFKNKPTGQRQFSTPEEILAGTSTRPSTFRRGKDEDEDEISEVESGEESSEVESESERKSETKGKINKRNGVQGLIEIENPNLVKSKNHLKLKDVDLSKINTKELSRREKDSEELAKQKAKNLYLQGKTGKAKQDLERLAEIRQQRAEAARMKEEEKAAKEKKKAQGRR